MKTIYHIDAITKSLREICKKTTDYRDLTINTYFPKASQLQHLCRLLMTTNKVCLFLTILYSYYG